MEDKMGEAYSTHVEIACIYIIVIEIHEGRYYLEELNTDERKNE
jgi:hypothetical protein